MNKVQNNKGPALCDTVPENKCCFSWKDLNDLSIIDQVA